MDTLTQIDSPAALFQVLQSELSYCPCAYTDTLPVLRDLLQRVAKRSDSTKSNTDFSEASQDFEAYMLEQASGGVASWMVYLLERAGLLYHGANVFDVWITDKGRWLLKALIQYPDPQPSWTALADDEEEAAVS